MQQLSLSHLTVSAVNDCIGALSHLGPNVITFRALLHLGPNVITFRNLLHLGQLLHLALPHALLLFSYEKIVSNAFSTKA